MLILLVFANLIFYLSGKQDPCSLFSLFFCMQLWTQALQPTQKTNLLFIHVSLKIPNNCEMMVSHTLPLSEFEKADTPQRFSKNKSITVTFRLQCLLMGFWHNERFTEISNHTLLINSPFLKPPSVSHNCQPFEHASIISYTFISHLLTAAERTSRNMDKVAAIGLITI